MKLNVKTDVGLELTIEVESTDTVADVKNKLEEMVGVPKQHMRVSYSYRMIDDTKTLAYYGMKDGDLINCHCDDQKREELKEILRTLEARAEKLLKDGAKPPKEEQARVRDTRQDTVKLFEIMEKLKAIINLPIK